MSEKVALIVDDTEANRTFFERLLKQAGFTNLSAASGQAALERVQPYQLLTLALLDMQLPDMSGLELTIRLRHLYPDACLIMATMHDDRSLMQSAISKGCDVFLVKPHGFMELFKRLTTQGAPGLRAEAPMIIDQYGPRKFQLAIS